MALRAAAIRRNPLRLTMLEGIDCGADTRVTGWIPVVSYITGDC